MFVNDVEFVKLPQEQMTSLVWTDSVENFERILPYSWYNSAQRGFVVFGGISDWELRVGCDDWDKAAGEVIEHAAQTMENIAKDQQNLGRDGRDIADVIAEFTCLGISLRESRNGISIMKPTQSNLQLLDVLFDPIELI
jgi:hypothetical protein